MNCLLNVAGAAMAAAMFLAPVAPDAAMAEEKAAKPVIGACVGCLHKFTKDDLLQLLRDEGYGSVRASKKGNLVFFKAEGRMLGVNATKSGSLVFVYLAGSKPLPLEAINAWNVKSTFSKAIRISKGRNLLRTVLISSREGLSRLQVRGMTRMFATFLAPQFEKFCREELAKAAK